MLAARYSQATMDASEDFTSATPDAPELTEEYTQWEELDRRLVNKLLDHSDASFAEEFSNQLHVQSGWEEALQKKSKKAKTGDNDYHCLLCIDVKLSQNPEPDFPAGSESPEANFRLAQEREDKGFAVPTKYQGRSSSSPSSSPSAICCPSTELQGYKRRGKAKNRPDKITNAFQETLSSIAIKVPEPSPLDKGKEVMENLVVFPPTQRSSFPCSTMEVTKRSVEACSLLATDSLTAENTSYGIPVSVEMFNEGKEATAGSRMETKVSEDNYGCLSPKYHPCHSSSLLSAFSMGNPRSYVTSSDALPQATNILGRKVKYDDEHNMSTKSYQGYRTRWTGPNLPVLGTRVPISSASRRVL